MVPDARRPTALEVYAVEQVRESRADGTRRFVLPFHRLGRADAEGETAEAHFIASRRSAPPALGGTETLLTLRDEAFDATRPADGVLTVEALCCNRDLPSMLPFGGGQPHLRIAAGGSPAAFAEALSPPTPTLRPRLRERGAWKLISHLALNHLSVSGGEAGALALREMLRLHDLRDSPESRSSLAALLAVEWRLGWRGCPVAGPARWCAGWR